MQPVLSELEPDNNLAENKFMTYLVFTIMSIIMAPVIFIACIVPSKTEQFKIALAKSIRG